MSDKMIFIAFVMHGSQLIRYAFDHPIIEYWGEPAEQKKLKRYFKKNHYTHDEPLAVEPAEILDYMPYVEEPK